MNITNYVSALVDVELCDCEDEMQLLDKVNYKPEERKVLNVAPTPLAQKNTIWPSKFTNCMAMVHLRFYQ